MPKMLTYGKKNSVPKTCDYFLVTIILLWKNLLQVYYTMYTYQVISYTYKSRPGPTTPTPILYIFILADPFNVRHSSFKKLLKFLRKILFLLFFIVIVFSFFLFKWQHVFLIYLLRYIKIDFWTSKVYELYKKVNMSRIE